MAASERGERVLAFIDIKKAYLYAKSTRETYIQLPPGDQTPGMCGKLNVSLYGTRDAAYNWEQEYSSTLLGLGFTRGIASPCIFRHHDRNIDLVVHGDDFTALGTRDQIAWLERGLSAKYPIKMRGIMSPNAVSGGEGDVEEITVLNRVLRWDAQGIQYEADPRHAEIIIRELGLLGSKGVSTPGVKHSGVLEEGEPLSRQDSTKFRALVARANYLAQDRVDIQFAVKELTRRMSAPDSEDLVALKRLGRYLQQAPRVVSYFANQSKPKLLECWVDTDWAGCVRTRRSTSGGGLRMGAHTLKTWSSTQATVALSSGEAEFYGLVKGASQMLGMRSLLRDFSIDVKCRLYTDSSAAKGIASRTGLGKTRHVAVHLLWVQERIREKDFELLKCKGTDNPADLMTKHLAQELIAVNTRRWSSDFVDGRSSAAPQCVV